MTLHRLASAVAMTALLTVLGPGTTFAADYKMNGNFGWLAVGAVTQIDKGHLYWTGQFSGPYQDGDKSSPLSNMSWDCPGYNDFGIVAGGYCVMTDNAGDALYAKWPSDGTAPHASGSFTFNGGTGKFAGATGGGKFTADFVGASHPDGNQVGYSTFADDVLTISSK